jgi:hypothetical protein
MPGVGWSLHCAARGVTEEAKIITAVKIFIA